MKSLITALALACAASPLALAAPATAAPTSHTTSTNAAKPAYAVTMQVSRKTIVKGEKLVIRGKVQPRATARGEVVVVQAQYADRKSWTKVGTARINRTGRYRYVDTIQTDRNRSYRVVKKAGDGLARATSTASPVTVYAWQSLLDLPTSAAVGTVRAYQVPINGVTHSLGIVGLTSSPTSYAEWTLGRRCTELRTTAGLTDRTPSGGTGSVAIAADGTSLLNQAFTLGSSVEKSFSVSGVYRLRVDFAQTNNVVTEPALGDPEVLCTQS